MEPGTKKVLIGCGIAAGVFVLLVIAAIGIFAVWVTQKADILQPEVFLSPEDTGFFQATATPDQPYLREFLKALNEKQREQQYAQMPESLKTVMQSLGAGRNDARGMERVLPVRVVLLSLPRTDGRPPPHAVVVSISGFSNLFRPFIWMASREAAKKGTAVKYRGAAIFSERKGDVQNTFCYLKPHFIISDSRELTEKLIDRIQSKEAGHPAREVEKLLPEIQANADAWGFQVNDHGELLDIYKYFYGKIEPGAAAEADWSAAENVIGSASLAAVSSKLTGADEITARIIAVYPDASTAEGNARALEDELRELLVKDKFQVESSHTVQNNSVDLQFKVRGIVEALRTTQEIKG
jgi:hypothetical protein